MVTVVGRGKHEDLVRSLVGAWESPSSPMVCMQWGSDVQLPGRGHAGMPQGLEQEEHSLVI